MEGARSIRPIARLNALAKSWLPARLTAEWCTPKCSAISCILETRVMYARAMASV
jgi:hypothetical protein